ncbi:TPA: 50S ribosomal protein L37ae [Candidatus Woesearchaeota archaeon]|nr:50S ribosomal protein L37ae [Candidatus Woesearchaeota archaeon]HII68474.1 50S ribosomal protein L37ae [Candidatus Woesearchaeota archaeon]
MATLKKYGSAKRFGARYGRRNRDRVAAIEKVLRSKHKCPYCTSNGVRRVGVGVWQCRKCDAKFTGLAYAPSKKGIEVQAEDGEQEV